MSAVEPGAPAHRRGNVRRAVLLVAVAVGLFGLSLLAAIVTPRWQAERRLARARATLAQLRQFESLFQQYAARQGDWPATAAPGMVPAGMAAALAGTPWSVASPFGGRYMWQVNTVQRGIRVHAAIALVAVPSTGAVRDRRDLEALLALAASDKVAARRLRLGFQDEPIYVLEN